MSDIIWPRDRTGVFLTFGSIRSHPSPSGRGPPGRPRRLPSGAAGSEPASTAAIEHSKQAEDKQKAPSPDERRLWQTGNSVKNTECRRKHMMSAELGFLECSEQRTYVATS